MNTVAAILLVVAASACSSGGGSGHELDRLCRFSAPPLTSGTSARQMAADIQAAMPQSVSPKARNLKIKTAALKLMVAAGSAVPTSDEDQASTDLSLDTAIKAQIDLATACA